ncbi:SDR family oxidoreductase [Rhizobiaceae bacterium]|nr:SDR family oxidoreductase [Rhizobiaceae bacterium]
MDLGLKGKKALVLGASRGLGAAIARGLATEGAEVVAAARNADTITAWASEVEGSVTALQLDLSDRDAVTAATEKMVADGGFDILVANTGGPPPGSALETGRDAWSGQFEAIAGPLIHIASSLVPGMQAKGWGRVLTIASSGVEQPIPNLALSNGIRAALVGWSKTLSNEVAGDGVTVNVILPGRIHTQRIDELDAAAAKRSGKDVTTVAEASRKSIPIGRYGDPKEFADVAVFLVSDRAGYMTGSRIRVDGGAIASV